MALTDQQRTRRAVLEAIIAHTEGEMSKHMANVELLLRNPLGIPQHPDVVGTVEEELDKVALYEGRLHVISSYMEFDGIHSVD